MLNSDNIIIIIGEHDISVAEGFVESLTDYVVYYFDPTLTDDIVASKLHNCEYVEWMDCPDYPSLVTTAHSLAFEFENDLDRKLSDLFPNCSIVAWQHLNLYYFFLSYQWYSSLWRNMKDRLVSGKLHVFINDNSVNYYWPSFLPGLLLLEQLRSWDISFTALTYGARPDESDVVMNLCTDYSPDEYCDVLTHLPTCFYDIGYFDAEIRASGKKNINIESKYWNVPLAAAKSINLIRLQDQQALDHGQPALEMTMELLREKLDLLLKPYISTPNFRQRQVQQLSNLYQSQLVCIYLLDNFFRDSKPHKILLSDHDAGFHGPLIHFAQKNNIPVYMLPHSKTSSDTEFSYENLVMFTHPVQGAPVLNGSGKRLLHYVMPYPESFSSKSSFPNSVKRIGLLMNGLALNGILSTNYSIYLDGIKQVNQWCTRHGVELVIRCRPGQALVEILNSAIGMDRGSVLNTTNMPLQDYVQGVDLCLMYDAPTAAAINFLRAGVPILNPVPSTLGKTEAATVDGRLVATDTVQATLSTLDSFIADENNFHIFCINQFSRYVSLFRNSYSLRRFL
jgi:hypothetical protein